MEMENRRREIARRKLRRQRQLRRRLAGGAAVIAVGLAAFICVGWLIDAGELSGCPPKNLESSSFVLNSEVLEGNLGNEKAPSLPSAFDLRDVYEEMVAPDQKMFQTCWAFASLKALESTVKEGVELSADHMTLQNGFGLGQNEGGDYSMASAYLLAWQGPVAETTDPYGDKHSADNAEPLYHVQEIRILRKQDLDEIKRVVYENGGVQSALYMPQTAGAEREHYYREDTSSFYYNGAQEPNHDVVIVGWDDHFSKENFVQRPETDGAFLCMNTWGTTFGDDGYFYISYEDTWIGESCVAYTGVEAVENYDRIFQTDLCGWTGQIGYGTSKAWFANVYEAQERVTLEACGFYATVPETSYQVYVKRLGTNDGTIGNIKKSEEKIAATGFAEYAGYYTIPLENVLEIEEGERFAIVIEIDSPETVEPVAMEYQADSRLSKVDISDGEGYISFDGVNWERTETEYHCNVCLKAYASVK